MEVHAGEITKKGRNCKDFFLLKTESAMNILFYVTKLIVAIFTSVISLDVLAFDTLNESKPMPIVASSPLIDFKRLEYAKEIISQYGDKISSPHQKNILEQKISLDMSPYEAKLAGGKFFFKVDVDRDVWAADTDPMKVMWHQSIAPDNSKIWMTFETATQFPDEGQTRFVVYFERGIAVRIEKAPKNHWPQ